MQEAAWDRHTVRGSLTYKGGAPPFVGWIQSNVFATNLTLLVDLAGTNLGAFPSATFHLRIYTYSTSGSGKVVRAQWGFTVGAGPDWEGPAALQSQAQAIQSGGSGGRQFLFLTGGVAGLGWGVEMSYQDVGIATVDNIVMCAIAHGREL